MSCTEIFQNKTSIVKVFICLLFSFQCLEKPQLLKILLTLQQTGDCCPTPLPWTGYCSCILPRPWEPLDPALCVFWEFPTFAYARGTCYCGSCILNSSAMKPMMRDHLSAMEPIMRDQLSAMEPMMRDHSFTTTLLRNLSPWYVHVNEHPPRITCLLNLRPLFEICHARKKLWLTVFLTGQSDDK